MNIPLIYLKKWLLKCNMVLDILFFRRNEMNKMRKRKTLKMLNVKWIRSVWFLLLFFSFYFVTMNLPMKWRNYHVGFELFTGKFIILIWFCLYFGIQIFFNSGVINTSTTLNIPTNRLAKNYTNKTIIGIPRIVNNVILFLFFNTLIRIY